MSNIGYVHMKKYRRPNRLRSIVIDEVSSVTKGSSPGATVLIRKSANDERETPMSAAEIFKASPEAAAMTLAENTIAARDAGKISEFTVNVVMEGFAKRLHGGDMAKFLASEPGKVFLRPRTTYVSAAENHEIAKKEGWFKSKPVAHLEEPDSDDDEPFEQKIARLMKEKNCSRDAAITAIYRKERVAKLGW